MTTRVYVTQETVHDFFDAESFGEIVFLTADDLNNIKGSLHNQSLIRDIARKLSHFDPHEDWILVAGSPFVSAAVFMMLGLRGFKSVKVLRWNNRTNKYVPLMMDLRSSGL